MNSILLNKKSSNFSKLILSALLLLEVGPGHLARANDESETSKVRQKVAKISAESFAFDESAYSGKELRKFRKIQRQYARQIRRTQNRILSLLTETDEVLQVKLTDETLNMGYLIPKEFVDSYIKVKVKEDVDVLRTLLAYMTTPEFAQIVWSVVKDEIVDAGGPVAFLDQKGGKLNIDGRKFFNTLGRALIVPAIAAGFYGLYRVGVNGDLSLKAFALLLGGLTTTGFSSWSFTRDTRLEKR